MRFSLLASLVLAGLGLSGQSPQNGLLDGLDELVQQQEVMLPMADGTLLATDIFTPVLSDDLAFGPFEFDIASLLGIPGQPPVILDRIKIADKGTRFFQYPNQADPFSYPIIVTRTPYNKKDPTLGQVMGLVGYMFAHQDMRGRYNSGGTYMPMFADAWPKTGYINYQHPLDTTATGEANLHQDGYELLQILTHNLRAIGDSAVYDPNPASALPYAHNGKIGMFGASALGNSQYSAAAVQPIDPDAPRGPKCMLPIVASGEFYYSTGHQNGCFRERIIDGWLRGQVERYDFDEDPDPDVYNFIHSLDDYGPQISTSFEAAEAAIDFWTTMNGAHYPNTPARAVMDISAAGYAADGVTPQHEGPVSRYKNMEVPMYHLTGWWDIFIDGQIRTWAYTREHLKDTRGYQKLVITPCAHQTIGGRSTGDMREDPATGQDYRYPETAAEIIGIDLDNLDFDNLGDIGNSEVISWFRQWLGEPEIVLPPNTEWQFLGVILGDSVWARLPADTLRVSFTEFVNFIGGSGPLTIPLQTDGLFGAGVSPVAPLTFPALGESLLGPEFNFNISEPKVLNWDGDNGGIPNVRFYVPGAVNDGVAGITGPETGGYWFSADTFPIPNVTYQKLYFQADTSLGLDAPAQSEQAYSFLADPDFPVPTHGGANMIVRTPDDSRDSQGQMNFKDPDFRTAVLDRNPVLVQGALMTDLLQFESPAIVDSASVIGFSNCTIYAKANPIGGPQDSTSTEFMVRVLDVCPDGREMFVFEGAVNARARNYARSFAEGGEDRDAPWSNIVPDSIYEYKFQMLPIGYTFGHGHKIKVLVSSTNYPRYQPCSNIPLNPGEFFRRRPLEVRPYSYNGQQVFPRQSVNTLYVGPQYPSHIDMPIYGKAIEFEGTTARPSAVVQPNLTAFPNPATDALNVQLDRPGRYTAQLYNQLGQVVRTAAFEYSTQISVGGLPRGVYSLRVTSEDATTLQTRQVVLQ